MTRVRRIADFCWQAMRRGESQISTALLDFVYPSACLLCGSEINANPRIVCDACWTKLKPRHDGECPRCGAPVGPFIDLESGCGQCRKESFSFDRVIRLGVYDGEMRTACLRAKAPGGSIVSRGLASTLVDEKHSLFEEIGVDVVIPVPEHWTRRVFHPHYAAEVVSREIARKLGVRWSRRVLLKRYRTPKQATSPTPQRRQQQYGSFAVTQANHIAGKTVLLVDDILTTGSTASAAARALKKGGAKRVVIAVIAVSPLRK